MIAHSPPHREGDSRYPKRRYPRGGSYNVIDYCKERVQVIDLADRLVGAGALKRVGQQWTARCPLPDHLDRTPSFCVNAEKNLWYCFGCSVGGDVVELGRHAWGYETSDARTVAAEILMLYGYEPPGRPDSWFDKQERQKSTRDLIRDTRAEVLARRMWRAVFAPIISEIPDAKERVATARQLWPKVNKHARLLLEARDEEAKLTQRRKGAQ